MALELSAFFARVGKYFTSELTQNIEKQRDINGSPFSLIAPSTAKARQREKGLGRGLSVRLQTKATKNRVTGVKSGKLRSSLSVSLKRLLVTSKFAQGAFRSEEGRESVRVYVSPEAYDSSVSFRDIVRYNNAGSPSVNRNIKRPPLIFPVADQDVMKMRAIRSAINDFNSPATQADILRQLTVGIPPNTKTEINL